MSYAPIYSKLLELEARLATVETSPKPVDVGNTISTFSLTSDNVDAASDVLDELNKFKTNFVDLLNECNPLSTRIAQLSSTVATLATKEEVATLATKAELPDVSGFATKAELPDVSTFATKAELPDVSGFATKAELPDVSGLATKAELPDVSGFATKAELADLQAKFDGVINVLAQLNIKLNEANEKIVALETA
jgi:hypothetical protein